MKRVIGFLVSFAAVSFLQYWPETYILKSIHVYVYIHIYTHVYACSCVYTCMYICVGVYVYMIIRGCMFIFLVEQIFKKYDRPIFSSLAFILLKISLSCGLQSWLVTHSCVVREQPIVSRVVPKLPHVWWTFGETEEPLHTRVYMGLLEILHSASASLIWSPDSALKSSSGYCGHCQCENDL